MEGALIRCLRHTGSPACWLLVHHYAMRSQRALDLWLADRVGIAELVCQVCGGVRMTRFPPPRALRPPVLA